VYAAFALWRSAVMIATRVDAMSAIAGQENDRMIGVCRVPECVPFGEVGFMR
jgi:hypothetical protein